jgi:hypothetical protein
VVQSSKLKIVINAQTARMLGLTVTAQRRFPPPWSIEEPNDACFIVKDSAGQKLVDQNSGSASSEA